MKILLAIIAALIVFYLAVWPVPIEPVHWEAPEDQGYSGAHAKNERLANVQLVSLGQFHGPEAAWCQADGSVVVGTAEGVIVRLEPDGRVVTGARVGGRPLGITRGDGTRLLVANADLGIQYVTRDDTIGKITDRIGGKRINYANGIVRHSDGRVFFTDATQRFDPRKSGGTLGAAMMDILEHDPNGRLLVFDPANGRTEELLTGLAFANGVALDPDEQFLLVAETASYRILRYWIAGPNTGRREIVIDNLPGFPDNLTTGRDGRFWIGISAPRNALLDRLSDKPFARKVIQRLPEFLRPKAAPYSHVIAIAGDGTVLHDLQGSSTGLPMTTGACETDDDLYITSLTAAAIGKVSKRSLGM